MSDTANDDSPKSKSEDSNWPKVDPDGLDKLYGVYDWLLAISTFLTGKALFFFWMTY